MSKRPSTITRKQVAALLKPRPHDSHKGLFGAVAVIGGATGMAGAPLLAARAALKMGAGCVHVCLLAENVPAVDMAQPELMLHGAQDALNLIRHPAFSVQPEFIGGHHSAHASTSSTRTGRGNPVAAIGCGLGQSKEAQKLLYKILQHDVPVVVDADALNLIARDPGLQNDVHRRKAATVLTPHPGEAARLLGCTTAEVQADRTNAIRQLGRKFDCSIVLKGADSLCMTSVGRLYLNKTGNPGMSSAGMGDVLTGMIAAFIAQGLDADQAMLLAAHLHGAAGDALAERGIMLGMTASELTEWARWLLNQWISPAA